MYTTLNKQTSFFVALSLVLVLFSTCKKGNSKHKSSNTPTIQWQKTIGDNDTTIINSVEQTTDGGYILAGYKINGLNGIDYWIVKLNNNADLEWEKTYGGNDQDVAKSIQQTTDGGYIVIGSSHSNNGDVINNNGNSDAWILKLSTNGNIEWQKTYGGSSSDELINIEQTSDNGYIAVGFTNSNDGDIPDYKGFMDAWVIKIAANGNLEWSKTFGERRSDFMNNVSQTIDNGYLIIGNTESINDDIANSYDNTDYWILKLQANGNLAWQKTYGGSGFDGAMCTQKTNEEHYTIVGYTVHNNENSTNAHRSKNTWGVKIDNLGNILQQTTINTNGDEFINSMSQTHDNNFLIAGYSQSINTSGDRIFIAKLDSNCRLLWEWKKYQESGDSNAKAIFETPDYGCIVFVNQTLNFSSSNILIIKLK